MGFLRRLAIDANSGAPPYGADPLSNFWYHDVGYVTSSGMPVTATTSMRYSAVWAAYRAIVEGVSGLPCLTYRRLARGKERVGGHPLYDVLRWFPNRWQTAMEYWEGVVGHATMRGDHFSLIVPGARGAVDQLEPLHPDRMEVTRSKSGPLRYTYWSPEPGVGEQVYTQDEIFHVRGLGECGLRGMAVLAYARENFGLQLARERYQAKLFGKAPMMAGILEAPAGAVVTESQQDQMTKSFREAHSGEAGWHSVAMLQGGVTWKATGMNARDAQFIESAEFGINDIARWFNVPVHLLRSQKDPNHSNIEMFDQEFVMHSLRPWCVRIEQAIQRDLVIDTRSYFAEFLLEAMIRANQLQRYQSYQSAIQSGWMTRNEARETENRNPLPGLDEPLQPLNMGTPGQLTQARRVATAAAERIVRKEIETLKTAAPKFAGKPAEWGAHVAAFYAKHERVVSQALALSDTAARAYVVNQRATVLNEGLVACEGWMDTVPGFLAALALEPAELPTAA